MNGIPAIDDAERWVVDSALRERYGRRVDTERVEVELKLAPQDEHLTACPTLYWEARGAALVITKVADCRYRTRLRFRIQNWNNVRWPPGRPDRALAVRRGLLRRLQGRKPLLGERDEGADEL